MANEPSQNVLPQTCYAAVEPQLEVQINYDVNLLPSTSNINETGENQGTNDDFSEILGEDPSTSVAYGPDIHKDVASRFTYIATKGLDKEARKNLVEKFQIPNNSKFIAAPKLNAELKAAIIDTAVKRDKSIEIKQCEIAAAISSLGTIISNEIKSGSDKELIQSLMDMGRLLCDIQYNQSICRRSLILGHAADGPNATPTTACCGTDQTCDTEKERSTLLEVIQTKPPSVDELERCKYLNLMENNDYNEYMTLPSSLLPDLNWWLSSIMYSNNSIKDDNNYCLEIFSDASTTGWGASCGDQRASGRWSQEEIHFHINQLELLAAYFALKIFSKNYSNCNILMRVDNTTAISYINRMGGIQYPHLSKVARDIWQWCEPSEHPQKHYPGCRDFVRTALLQREIPSASADIILASISESTLKQYDVCYKKWYDFCVTNMINMFEPSVPMIIQFLTKIFVDGAQYGTINSYRSALSFIIKKLPDDDRISRFCKGVFKLRPSLPRYNFTWDAGVTINYLATLFPNENLTLEQLTKKCVTLLALVTAHRVQTLSKIKLNEIVYCNDKIMIKICDLIKTSRPGMKQPLLYLPYYCERPEICPASTLRAYIDRSKDIIRPENYLFVSFRKPYKNVSPQTLSRWIKITLQDSGIDVSIFKSHSTRHAATSMAKKMGINIDNIRQAAGWSGNSSTFARFYDRPIIDKDNLALANTLCSL
ncbi:uncharacterized protein LOC121736230 [Aricia agestis]|uniref:uncharacterized protein LOC121736230 n=1 Tax=Aricia agestis TaxID=91739 RepID=UPI001C205B6C|nr:uncharacterized protein LOC121736230 [Aricia agestis]